MTRFFFFIIQQCINILFVLHNLYLQKATFKSFEIRAIVYKKNDMITRKILGDCETENNFKLNRVSFVKDRLDFTADFNSISF